MTANRYPPVRAGSWVVTRTVSSLFLPWQVVRRQTKSYRMGRSFLNGEPLFTLALPHKYNMCLTCKKPIVRFSFENSLDLEVSFMKDTILNALPRSFLITATEALMAAFEGLEGFNKAFLRKGHFMPDIVPALYKPTASRLSLCECESLHINEMMHIFKAEGV